MIVVMLNTRPGIGIPDVQAIFRGNAWYRAASNVWIVDSDENPTNWQLRIARLVNPGGSALVARIGTEDIDGWMDQGFWNWWNARAR